MEARYWEAIGEDKKILCQLCPHACLVMPGKSGRCHVRYNENGVLQSLSYGKVIASHIDPVEKKPLARFMSGQLTLSMSCGSCNMRCRHCQNYPISCELPLEQYSKAPDTSPEALLHQLQKSETSILSYTYAEPTISYEYLLDTSKLVRKAGYYTVLVSNGFLNPAPWHELLPWINAMNIDIKGNEEIYDQECAAPGAYKRVLENVRRAYQSGVHVEITTLLIPRIHDKIINQLVNDIEGISRDIVWHISAYFPQYRSSAPPTSAQRVREVAAMIRNRGFRYVYTGNI